MNRCNSCRNVTTCPICGSLASGFHHVGVRGTTTRMRIPIVDVNVTLDSQRSGIWHYSDSCGHRVYFAGPAAPAQGVNVIYNGGPLWKDGYTWQNVFWGSFFALPSSAGWVQSVQRATANMEADTGFSGGLRQYGIGIGKLVQPVTVNQDPPKNVSNQQIQQALMGWIRSGTVKDMSGKGAHNIFMPPGTVVSLSSDLSCSQFCDFHDTVNGSDGPFYTVEPYPCSEGCNQCTKNPLDTLTQGLSEELVELKTDMDPGTGWVIGNEEICDFCDPNFVCNRITTGEYVNSWYDKQKGACWIGKIASIAETPS